MIQKSSRTAQGKLLIASVAENCRESALKYHTGIECSDFCTAYNMEDPVWLRHVEELLDGVSLRVLHAPINELCPAAIDPLVRRVTRYRHDQAWETAQKYHINRMVVHSGFLPSLYYPEWFIEQSVTFWKDFMNSLPDDCEVMLENVQEPTPEMGIQIVEGVDDPRMTLCLDIGHANSKASDIPVDQWVRSYAPRLGHVHIHNNAGVNDTHSALCDGTIPMHETLTLLDTLAPNATWTVEACESVRSCAWLAEHGWLETPEK